MRRILLLLTAALLLPALAGAYTIVLKDGRKLEAKERYQAEGALAKFTGADGKPASVKLSEIDDAATAAANQPKRPRVWTNDELELLVRAPSRGGLSGFGAAPAPPKEGEEAEEEEGEEEKQPLPAKETTAEHWQGKIRPLRDEIASIDQEIASLRRNSGNASSNAVSLTSGSGGVQVEDKIRRLEQRKAEVQRQIEDLEAEAKRNGVSPGELR